jgi:hypothetical protein
MKLSGLSREVFFGLIVLTVGRTATIAGAQQPEHKKIPTPGPMLNQGTV